MGRVGRAGDGPWAAREDSDALSALSMAEKGEGRIRATLCLQSGAMRAPNAKVTYPAYDLRQSHQISVPIAHASHFCANRTHPVRHIRFLPASSHSVLAKLPIPP